MVKKKQVTEALAAADQFYAYHQYTDAIESYKVALGLMGRSNPKDCEKPYLRIGKSYIQLQNPKEAIKFYNKAIQIDPSNAETYCEKGYAYSLLYKYTKAEKHYNKALAVDPNNITALNNKGEALQKLEKHQEAVVCYDKALKLDTDNATAYNNKAVALIKIGKEKEALELLDRSLSLDSTNSDTHHSKGHLLLNLKKYNTAIDSLEEAIRLDKKSKGDNSSKKIAMEKLGAPEKARAYGAQATYFTSKLSDSYYRKSEALLKIGRHQEAVDCITEYLEFNPRDTGALNHKGRCYRKLGEHSKAAACFEEAVKINPKNLLYLCNMGRSLSEGGKSKEALDFYNRAVAIKESKGFGSDLSKGNRSHIQGLLDKDRVAIIKKVSQLAAVDITFDKKLDSPTYGRIPESIKAKYRKQADDLRSKQKKNVANAVKFISEEQTQSSNSSEDRDVACQSSNIRCSIIQLEETEAEVKGAVAKMLSDLFFRLEKVEETKASKAEVSHAIRINESEEKKAAQMQEIESFPKLKEYYKGFVSTFSKLFTTSQAVLSGKLTLDTEDIKVTMVTKLVSLVPFCGEVLGGGIEALNDFVRGAGIKSHATKFLKLASSTTELDAMIGEVAREVTLTPQKKRSILEKDSQEEVVSKSWFRKLSSKFQELGMNFNDTMCGEEYSTAQAKLGYRDAATLIDAYIEGKVAADGFKNYLIKTADKKPLLDPATNNPFIEPPQGQQNLGSIQEKERCVLMYQVDIKYDNPYLDTLMHNSHPAKSLKEHFALLAELGVEHSDFPV